MGLVSESLKSLLPNTPWTHGGSLTRKMSTVAVIWTPLMTSNRKELLELVIDCVPFILATGVMLKHRRRVRAYVAQVCFIQAVKVIKSKQSLFALWGEDV